MIDFTTMEDYIFNKIETTLCVCQYFQLTTLSI